MDYSLRELECFIAAAEEGSFTRAAEKLRLAQPPLSRHIRALEEKLGSTLFDRSSRRATLTPAGGLFYQETRGILPQLTRAGEAVRRAAAGESAVLRLGFVSAVVSPELVEVFRAYRQAEPAVQLAVEDRSPADQVAGILQGTLDGGFVGVQPEEAVRGVQFIAWKKEPLACFVPSGHRLAGSSELSLRELREESFLAVAAHSAPAFAGLVRELCRRSGFRPRIVMESPRAQAVAVMVAAGSGIAILPQSLERVVGTAVAGVPLARRPSIVHTFACRAGPLPGPLKAFRRCLDNL